jgi:hypothetical protein
MAIMMSGGPRGKCFTQCRHQRQVAGGQRRHADNVHFVVDGLARGLVRRGKQRADLDLEAEVGERGGNNLLAAVVTVLAHLGDEDARHGPSASVKASTAPCARTMASDILAGLAPVDVLEHPRLGDVTAPDLFQCAGYLADGGLGPRGINRSGEQVAFACPGACWSALELFINL